MSSSPPYWRSVHCQHCCANRRRRLRLRLSFRDWARARRRTDRNCRRSQPYTEGSGQRPAGAGRPLPADWGRGAAMSRGCRLPGALAAGTIACEGARGCRSRNCCCIPTRDHLLARRSPSGQSRHSASADGSCAQPPAVDAPGLGQSADRTLRGSRRVARWSPGPADTRFPPRSGRWSIRGGSLSQSAGETLR